MSLVKRSGRRKSKKSKLKDGENLSFTEKDTVVEELKLTENVRDCFSEGDFDEKNVVGRVKLF